MNIKYIRNFIELAEVQSFSALASELSISQSTLSHQISQLEKELGVKLIDRTTRTFQLTGEGEIFLTHGKKIVFNYDSCVKEISAKNLVEKIIITASTLPGSHILPKYITTFKEEHPNVDFQILINNSKRSIELLIEGKVDFAGIGSVMNHDVTQFVLHKIGEDQLTFICSPNHELLKNGVIFIDFEDLVKYPFVIRENGSGTRDIIELEFNEFKQLNITLEINDNDSIISIVNGSNYISILSEIVAKKAENAGLIKILKIKNQGLPRRNIYFMKLKKKNSFEIKEKFWNYLTK